MGLESKAPTMSTLNPNASVFVPAARRVVVEESTAPVAVASPAAVDESVDKLWSRFKSDKGFREQCMSVLSVEQRNALYQDLAELEDCDQFEGYQEHLVDLEEEEILARSLHNMDGYLEEDLSLTGANDIKGVELLREQQQLLQQQQQVPSARNPSYYQNKTMLHKVGNYPKKWNTYRIHQPRSDM